MFECLNNEDEIYFEWLVYVQKILDEGFKSICHIWWRSRFHDFVFSKKRDFNFNSKAEKSWIIFYIRMKEDQII